MEHQCDALEIVNRISLECILADILIIAMDLVFVWVHASVM